MLHDVASCRNSRLAAIEALFLGTAVKRALDLNVAFVVSFTSATFVTGHSHFLNVRTIRKQNAIVGTNIL